MSYDIRFAVKVAGREELYAVIGCPEYDSPTYNVGNIFREACQWDFKQGEWYALKDVLTKIEHGFKELTDNPKAYKHLEPDNRWGSVESARNCLKSILDYFEEPFEGLRGSWNADIPIECIYMSW